MYFLTVDKENMKRYKIIYIYSLSFTNLLPIFFLIQEVGKNRKKVLSNVLSETFFAEEVVWTILYVWSEYSLIFCLGSVKRFSMK